MFLTFLFRSAPEEGLYCKPKYRAKKFVFLKNKYISVILAFVVCSLKLVTSAVGISLPLIFSNHTKLLVSKKKKKNGVEKIAQPLPLKNKMVRENLHSAPS